MGERARFPWGLSVAAAVVFAILCGLGVWQLERKAEKTRDLHRLATLSRRLRRRIPRPTSLAALVHGVVEVANSRAVTAAFPGIETRRSPNSTP